MRPPKSSNNYNSNSKSLKNPRTTIAAASRSTTKLKLIARLPSIAPRSAVDTLKVTNVPDKDIIIITIIIMTAIIDKASGR